MNIICSIFGHRNIIRDWYPHDPITTLACDRCDKIIEQRANPMYVEGAMVIYPDPPNRMMHWNYSETSDVYYKKTMQIISPIDPYGEEQWEVEN